MNNTSHGPDRDLAGMSTKQAGRGLTNITRPHGFTRHNALGGHRRLVIPVFPRSSDPSVRLSEPGRPRAWGTAPTQPGPYDQAYPARHGRSGRGWLRHHPDPSASGLGSADAQRPDRPGQLSTSPHRSGRSPFTGDALQRLGHQETGDARAPERREDIDRQESQGVVEGPWPLVVRVGVARRDRLPVSSCAPARRVAPAAASTIARPMPRRW